MTLINTTQAAERLSISIRRVQVLINTGRLPAQKVGRDWLINDEDLQQVQERPNGYPKGRKRSPSEASPV